MSVVQLIVHTSYIILQTYVYEAKMPGGRYAGCRNHYYFQAAKRKTTEETKDTTIRDSHQFEPGWRWVIHPSTHPPIHSLTHSHSYNRPHPWRYVIIISRSCRLKAVTHLVSHHATDGKKTSQTKSCWKFMQHRCSRWGYITWETDCSMW